MVRLMLSLCVFFACAAPEVDPLPFPEASSTASPDPAQFGPYPVGVRTVTYEDTGRRKPDGTPRQLVTEIWYPAVQTARGQDTVHYDVVTLFTAQQQADIGEQTVPLLETLAVRDATPARAHGAFPLVIFSHGQSAIRWQSTYFTVLLASHGYVVAAPDHEGGTLFEAVRGHVQSAPVGVENRPIDVIYLLNRFERLKEDDPLFGLIDFEHIGVAGHSFGALTALRVAALDPRVKVIVPQAPVDANVAWVALPQPVRLGIPVHIQGAHHDRTLPWDTNVEPTLKALEPPYSVLDIVKGGHFTFSDLCAFDLASILDRVKFEFPGVDLKQVVSDGCGPEAPPASVAQRLINHFAVAYLNAHLKNSSLSRDLMNQAHADQIAGEEGVAVITTVP